MSDYLKTADVWLILDLIVAEFTSDPTSTQCFDTRIVARAIELNSQHRRSESRLLEALKALAREHDGAACFCGVATGAAKEHAAVCRNARAALERYT